MRRLLRAGVVLAGLLAGCDRARPWTDGFASDPFVAQAPRWCERYHHAHATAGGLAILRSERAPDACTSGGGHSCVAPGCDACDCEPPCSPCAKAGDANGNAVVMTTFDAVGVERIATARFRIERQLPPGAHVGIYAALHPHCHTTVQGLLVADRPGEFHMNVAAFNQDIGGDAAMHEVCRLDPFGEISPPLAGGLVLEEGRSYAWELSAILRDGRRVEATSTVRTDDEHVLATARYEFDVPGAWRWFGVAGEAARYAFGAQYTLAPSPSGGEPELRLQSFTARP